MGTVHFTVGPLIGEQLLDIAQTNITKGNIEYAANLYKSAFHGFTDELTLKVLKNELVVVTDEDGLGINLSDDPELIKKNAHNMTDWKWIINERLDSINGIHKNLISTCNSFVRLYHGDILNYSIIDMMKRYFTTDELSTIGIHNIAARIIGSEDGKICDTGASNPTSIWEKLESKIESDPEHPEVTTWEQILYYTVKYNKLIKMLYKEYVNFENTYFYLVENGFIEKPIKIELCLENTIKTLVEFADDCKGYYHPLCNTSLYAYKNKLYDGILKTRIGKEYCTNGIIKKNIMDGYDAGWLSPDGEFYGGDGETSSMIHMNIAEDIFRGNNIYANRMKNDDVEIFGGSDSPEYWLEKHGWIKIHHNDCYGSFIGMRNEKPTKDFPYSYNPTPIQIKMVCDYADKFYRGKFYTEANALGRYRHPEPFSTYKVRQMDDLKIHETFGM